MKKSIRTTPDMKPAAILRTLLLGLMLTVTAEIAVAGKEVPWNMLNQGEQSVLRQHHGNWSSYTPSAQQKLQKGARRYLDLSPGERRAVEQKRNQFEKMSPRERKQLHEKYRRYKKGE